MTLEELEKLIAAAEGETVEVKRPLGSTCKWFRQMWYNLHE